MTDDDDRPEFSVAVFYTPGGHYDYMVRFVSAGAAFEEFRRCVNAAEIMPGVVSRIIITDGGDFTNAEWKAGEGFTYPPELVGKQPK